ncbi:MAG TPA: N-acetylmuramoyl-L-alanine amidase [Prolixibacteraceae bacterium]|nr:N-acetylmuramoyl-L-alanine amidase [Prolixibacteraceae bacterium]
MKALGKFILIETTAEFTEWLNIQQIIRKINLVQQHHTYIPAYRDFKGDNHFALCQSMEKAHIERGFSQIAQNFTTFPDGKVMVCRDINIAPAGIKGANSYGVCIEHVGNFDKGKDVMADAHKQCIIAINKALLQRFKLVASDQSVVYHHWYDLTTGKRIQTEGSGNTKTCPGTAFFEGNTIVDFKAHLLPLL